MRRIRRVYRWATKQPERRLAAEPAATFDRGLTGRTEVGSVRAASISRDPCQTLSAFCLADKLGMADGCRYGKFEDRIANTPLKTKRGDQANDSLPVGHRSPPNDPSTLLGYS